MAYLYCKNIGNGGRLGNQLFTIAATIGIARANGMLPLFPSNWKYRKDFNIPDEMFGECETSYVIKEEQYHHLPIEILYEDNLELRGYFQSEKYWEHCEDEVRRCLSFKEPSSYPTDVAICIRRTDYVGNPNYYQLPASYYYLALMSIPDWRLRLVTIFSDDAEYCKHHFGMLPNVTISNDSDIEALKAISQADVAIIGNSTFHWWGAYLGENKKVIRPNHYFAGPLAKNTTVDLWPESWKVFEHEGKKLNLSDVTFTIPVKLDHHDRRQNLDLIVCMLQLHFDTKIIVGEQGTYNTGYMSKYCTYFRFVYKDFHRTKMLNEMAKMANTSIVANYDCDVLFAPLQIWAAVEKLRTGEVDMIYPYDGRFARVKRAEWFTKLERMLDTGALAGYSFPGMANEVGPSVGGAVIVNKRAFIESGMENEHFVSYGPEDCERKERWDKLGYKVERIPGALYHIDHYRGIDSGTQCPHFKPNHVLYNRIKSMDKATLLEHVAAWQWVPAVPKIEEPKGYAGGWKVEDAVKEHAFSLQLAAAMASILDKSCPVYDLGCGPGFYVAFLRQRKFAAKGFEYTDMSELGLVNGITKIDLSEPLTLKHKGQIICLEVGEHMPVEQEMQLLDNITNNAAGKIIMSWAIPGQDGFGHVNCRSNSYIIHEMAARGWNVIAEDTALLRRSCSGCTWFENSIMVFEK